MHELGCGQSADPVYGPVGRWGFLAITRSYSMNADDAHMMATFHSPKSTQYWSEVHAQLKITPTISTSQF